jgi:hypothetical protein
MSILNFIPSVWAAEILRALDTLLVYASPQIINNDYEGEIANAGDSVRITTLGDVTVQTYTRNADIAAPETLSDAQLTLLIDQQKYFNFQLDDVDRRQALQGLREEAARRAAYGLRKVMDSFVAGLYVEIAAGQFIGSDGSPITGFNVTNTKAYDQLVDLNTRLNNTDTPEDGRWVVVPPWYEGYLEKDPRYTGFGTATSRVVLENGMTAGENGLIGRGAGFDIYRSNQVPNVAGAKHKVIAGHRLAWSRAQQILETEAYRPERRFADALKGLHVYGAKVLRPDNLACLVASDS